MSVKTETVQNQAQDDFEEPDEKDRAEIEAIRKDVEEKEAQRKEEKKQNGQEPAELAALRLACQGIQDKIDWHENEKDRCHEEIDRHNLAIRNLRSTLQESFSSLVGEISGEEPEEMPKPRNRPGRKRKNYGEGGGTGNLIATFLKKSRKPVNTAQVEQYLRENGNNTNPSVELSRMVNKGVVRRPGRGLYEWAGGEEGQN